MANQRRRRSQGARRAVEAQEQRRQGYQRTRQRRGRRRVLLGAAVLVVLAAIITAVVIPRGPQLGESVAELPGSHAPPFRYNSQPPTSGNHLPTSVPYGHSFGTLVAEAAVHNMEHGAVVIWYEQGNEELASQVDLLVRQLGRSCLVAGAYPRVASSVAATTWGRILELDEFDGAQLREFVEAYRGRRGPEAGLCRQG